MDEPFFTGEFREWMDTTTPMKWAANLTQDQLATVLWAVWEVGMRAQPVVDWLGPSGSGRHPVDGCARIRVGLQILQRLVHGERPTWEEVAPLVASAIAELEGGPGKPSDAEPL